jgi:hypothetical protein
MAYLIATLGLVAIARALSEKEEEPQVEYYEPPKPAEKQNQYEARTNVMHSLSGGMGGVGMNPYGKAEQPSFGEVGFMKHVNGEPVRDFRSRPYVSGKMNNLTPSERTMVGPGLNVGADVPAFGGYQQVFQVKPNNVGAYKLTTLPGRVNHGANQTGGMPGMIGELTHYKPSTTAYLPSRLPNVKGRAQGQGGSLNGVIPRGEYQKTKRTTNRAETTMRTDGLEFAPAKKFISNATLAQDPTRNKGDINVLQYSHTNNPAPGIHSFHGGYTNAPGSQLMAEKSAGGYTTEQLQAHGFRPADRRGQKDRTANAGRMNVRADPLNQGGMITAVRSDTSRTDGRKGGANGGWSQNYVAPMYQENNAYKGTMNPRASSAYLKTATNQLESNPLAHSISG